MSLAEYFGNRFNITSVLDRKKQVAPTLNSVEVRPVTSADFLLKTNSHHSTAESWARLRMEEMAVEKLLQRAIQIEISTMNVPDALMTANVVAAGALVDYAVAPLKKYDNVGPGELVDPQDFAFICWHQGVSSVSNFMIHASFANSRCAAGIQRPDDSWTRRVVERFAIDPTGMLLLDQQIHRGENEQKNGPLDQHYSQLGKEWAKDAYGIMYPVASQQMATGELLH